MRKTGAVFAFCAAVAAYGQQPPVLRTETRAVLIHVEVEADKGKSTAGLTRSDFTVTDNGRRREIRIFSAEPASPAIAGATPDITLPPNVFTNLKPTPARAAHATVILLDAINNYWDHMAAARASLFSTVNRLRKDERIAIYVATTRPAGISLLQGFTTDRARLLSTILNYSPAVSEPAPGMLGPPRAPQLSTKEGYAAKAAIPQQEEDFRRRGAVVDTMAVFRVLAEHLGKTPGRKSVLWVTSGLPPRQLRELPDPYEKAVQALNEANVAVNVLDDDGVGSYHRRWGREAALTLGRLANDTGGKAYVGRNGLADALVEAIEAPRRTYVLGFYLSEEERDENYHRLAVRVARRGLRLRHRQGYYASAGPGPRGSLEGALLGLEDAEGIGVAAEAHAVAAGLHLDLRLRAGDVTLHQQDGAWVLKLEVLFLLTDVKGKELARVAEAKEYRVSGAGPDDAAANVIALTREISVPAGARQLLIVVRDGETGRSGTLAVPLDSAGSPAAPPLRPKGAIR